MTNLKYYTVNEVMEILKVTRLTVYNYVKDGRLKGNKVANKWLFTEEQIKDCIEGK
jgi:excisionase family DNA binding protein